MHVNKNVIITGIPRSGTTLLAALVDTIPDAVALQEPQWQISRAMQGGFSAQDFAKWLVGDFVEIRRHLLKGVPVADRRGSGGQAVTNHYRREGGARRRTYETVPFTRAGLSENFLLAVKQPGLFLCMLEALLSLDYFRIVAIVRHPVDVILSWQSLTIPASNGALIGSAYWPNMHALIESTLPLLEKQVKMYDLMCRRLHRWRDRITVLRHEDLVQSPELLAQVMGMPAAPYDASLIHPQAGYRNSEQLPSVVQAVKQYGDFLLHFYPEQ